MGAPEGLEKLKQFMELAGLDSSKYEIGIKKKREREPLPPTVMLFQTFATLAASHLSPAACKVMFFFFSKTQYENVISIDQYTIAAQIDQSERSVRRAIKELQEYNVITAVPLINDRRRNEYFLNPYSSWKGSSLQRNAQISSMDENQLEMFGKHPKELKAAEKNLKEESSLPIDIDSAPKKPSKTPKKKVKGKSQIIDITPIEE